MKKENNFKYMLYWQSIFVGMFFCIIISFFIIEPLIKDIKGDIYYIVHTVSTLIVLFVIIKYINNSFIRKGLYIIDKDSIYIKLNKKEYKYYISDINEVFCFKSCFLGFKFLIIDIKFRGKRIKLFSPLSLKNFEIDEKDLFNLYEDLKHTDLFKEDENIFLLYRK